MIKHFLQVGFHSILLWLDSIVYEFVAKIYDIFMILARINIFKQDFYQDFAQRVYAILGVVMLFVLAYTLLQALVDPDKLTKGDKGGIAKLVPTFVVSLVIIGLLPSIFDFAYNIQNFILEENTIGTLVLGSSATTPDAKTARDNFGKQLSFTALHAFLNYEDHEGPFNNITWDEMQDQIAEDSKNFFVIMNLTDAIVDGDVTYRWGFSTAVGLFLIYVIATFCLDLAVRSVRLAFLQLIAPIPVLMRVLPTKNDMFQKWLKKMIACFTEVFVRVFIMYMAIYFISNLDIQWATGKGLTGALANILVIMGILMFVREFPKLLSEVTGIDSGNIKLGVKDFMGKLAAGGALTAAGALGAGITTTVRNAAHAGTNFKNATTVRGKAMSLLRGATSVAAGGVSGLARGGAAGLGAKNLSDVRKSAASGAQGATNARDRREAYRAAHGNSLRGVMGGHIEDMFAGAREWAQGGFEAEEARIKYYNDTLALQEKADSEAKALMERNKNNNAIILNNADMDSLWKGTDQQKDDYRRIYQQHFTNADGSTMSLDAMRSLVDLKDKEKIEQRVGESDVDFDNRRKQHVQDVANYKAVLAQVEKQTWMRLESAAYDEGLRNSLGFTNADDINKFLGITSHIDQVNNKLEARGEATIDLSNAGKSLDDRMTSMKNERDRSVADLNRRKDERNARRGNSGNGNS